MIHTHSKKDWTSPQIYFLNQAAIQSGETMGDVEAVFFSDAAMCGATGTYDPNATTNPVIMRCGPTPACGSGQLFLMVIGRTVATPLGLCS